MKGIGYARREVGLVHRLDTGTSGVLLAARNAVTFERLRSLLGADRIAKRYLAVCDGHVPLGPIELAIAHDPTDRRRMRTCAPMDEERYQARAARTEVLSSTPWQTAVGPASLVEVSATRARRHQVRVHLADLGHPLLGDVLYGGPEVLGLHRHALHASTLAIPELDIEATAPLPDDLVALKKG